MSGRTLVLSGVLLAVLCAAAPAAAFIGLPGAGLRAPSATLVVSRERRAHKAKTKKAETPKKAEPQKPAPAPPPPPYEPQLLRLSEILGGLSFLRDLCGEGDGADWRDKMSALLEAEAPEAGAQRQKLQAAFNRGFRGYELTYSHCTPNARTATARYLDEASRLARDISYRYGNP